MKFSQSLGILVWAVWAISSPGWLIAQESKSSKSDIGSFGLPSLSGTFGKSADNFEKVTFSASYELETATQNGRIRVTAQIASKHHIYSTTQPKGGPNPTRIRLESDLVEQAGPFLPDHDPKVSKDDFLQATIEEFHDRVIWTAPIQIKRQFDPNDTELPLRVDGQVCLADGSCQLFNKQFNAIFDHYYGTEQTYESLRPEKTHVTWSATVHPAQVQAGDRARIVLRAIPDSGYHIYRFDPKDKSPENKTIIVATQKAGLRFGTPKTQQEVITKQLTPEIRFEYHPGPVEWSIPVEIPETAQPGQYPVELLIGFNSCSDTSCDTPTGVRVSGTVTVAEQSGSEPVNLALATVPWDVVTAQSNAIGWIDRMTSDLTFWERMGGSNLDWWMVGAALLGGLILNFMPCVLPVIGLKLMSFVNQSGSSHARVVSLNLAFVAGILSVLMALAALNIGFKLTGQAFGWGEQFNRLDFQVVLTVLLFAMSLSFLGVWEIPIPGFATGSKSGQLMEREGLTGAFYKGALTTILATPCSGPFLGTLFGLTLTLSVWSILALFFLVGIGLGLPYLALCLWPGFVKWLPKPGAWMETLKELLAFPLLLTVVYFVAVIHPDYRIATLTLLIAVWFGCWLIGRMPVYIERRRKVAGWLVATGVSIAVGVFSFTYLGPAKHYLPWQAYSEKSLAEHRASGNVVMIDFTARWCATCQYNLYTAIDRPAVAEVVKQNNVVPLLADWTDKGDEIAEKLRELDSNSIPLLAIYPADPNAEPIILRDLISQSQLIEALERAGPSKPVTRLTSQPKYD